MQPCFEQWILNANLLWTMDKSVWNEGFKHTRIRCHTSLITPALPVAVVSISDTQKHVYTNGCQKKSTSFMLLYNVYIQSLCQLEGIHFVCYLIRLHGCLCWLHTRTVVQGCTENMETLYGKHGNLGMCNMFQPPA